MIRFFAIAFLFLLPAFISAKTERSESCTKDKLCLVFIQDDTGVDILFKYDNPIPSMVVTVEANAKLLNMTSSERLPALFTLSSQEEKKITRLQAQKMEKRWTYQVFYRFILGDYEAEHDDSYVYELPFQPGFKFRVNQAYDGKKSHFGENRYAIDFGLPEGTPITASRDGIVIETEDRNTEGGFHSRFLNSANYVKILHNDNTISQYAHLQYRGVLVSVGDYVRPGQIIGYSGNTGFSDGPHLHFEVFKPSLELKKETIAVKFRTESSDETTLQEGELHWRRGATESPRFYFIDEEATTVCNSVNNSQGQGCNLDSFSSESPIVIFISLTKPSEYRIEVVLKKKNGGVEKTFAWETKPDWWVTYLNLDLQELTEETEGEWSAQVRYRGKVWKELRFAVGKQKNG